MVMFVAFYSSFLAGDFHRGEGVDDSWRWLGIGFKKSSEKLEVCGFATEFL